MMRRRQSCLDCAVRGRTLCRALALERLLQLNPNSSRRRYPPGRLIAAADPVEDWFAIVPSGVVKLTQSLSDGRQQIVGLLFPSDFLGQPFKRASPCAAETATAVELCCFERKAFMRLLQEEADFTRLLLERTLEEVDIGRDWMLLLGRKSAEERVATLLLLMLRRMPGHDHGSELSQRQFELPLSRGEMADYLGLRIETVSRQLKRLKSAGVIETRGRTLVVQDLAALRTRAKE